MAIAPVTLVESLRPWAGAGLAYLLLDGPLRLPEGTAETAAPSPRERFAPQAEPQRVAVAPPPSQPTRPAPAAAPRPKASVKADSPAARPVHTFAASAAVPADPQDWPAPWAAQWHKTKPAPLIWTYHELGLDITGQGEPSGRGMLFRKLIAELRLPKGSSAFWPCAMPHDGVLQANAPLFTAGLLRLAPHVLVVSGDAALADIGFAPHILAPFRQIIIEGKLIVGIPDTAALLRDPQQVTTTISFLQAVLQPLAL